MFLKIVTLTEGVSARSFVEERRESIHFFQVYQLISHFANNSVNNIDCIKRLCISAVFPGSTGMAPPNVLETSDTMFWRRQQQFTLMRDETVFCF